jgi:UDP-N-acetylglucosamine acyltransferase
MPEIHPTSHLSGDIDLADDVRVGPGCVLDAPSGTAIRIGAGTRLIGSVYLQGPLTMGERNTIYPFVCLGFAPQDFKWDPANPGAGLVIGDDNTFREHATVHRATSDERPTRIGNANFFMAGSHAGHDSTVGNNCIFANNAAIGGHVRVDDRANIGGATMIHQYARVGRGAMLSGGVGATMDIPPFFMLTGINVVGSMNLIGMRRSGMSRDDIDHVRWVYRTLYRQGLSIRSALERLRDRADRPIVAEYIDFIESSHRGICTATGDRKRGTA